MAVQVGEESTAGKAQLLRTIAVIALKGGSGKTTIATHLALAAHRRGIDALVVDVDPQASALNVLSMRDEPGPACVAATGAKLMSAQFAAVGLKQQLMIIDTPAALVEDVGEAVVLSDLVVLVVRPTLLDLAGLARSLTMVKRLGKPHLVVINQAPVSREGVEAPLVKRALRGLEFMQATVSPVIVRSRTVYQVGLETGRTAEEMLDPAAAGEIAALWDQVWGALASLPEKALTL